MTDTKLVKQLPPIPDYSSMNVGMFWQYANKQTFAYGIWDCMQFLGAWGEVLTGENLAAPYYGKYSSKIQALDIIRKYGDSLEDLVDTYLTPKQPDLCMWGDAGLIKRNGTLYGCVIQVDNVAVLTQEGIQTVSLLDVVKGYSY